MGSPGVPKFDRARLAELVEAHPDATAPELREMLGVECGDAAIYKALKKLGLTFKKRRSTHRSRTGPTSPRGVRTGVKARMSSTPAA
jgi:transposase